MTKQIILDIYNGYPTLKGRMTIHPIAKNTSTKPMYVDNFYVFYEDR